MAAAEPPVSTVRKPIVRPPHSRPGSPAPWAELPSEKRTGLSLSRVVTALDHDASLARPQLSEPWRHLVKAGAGRRPAAVLVPLFEEEGETRVILTVRSDHLHSHQGEVAFPGGRLDGDESVVEAALREAYEEVGLQPGLVTVVGQLSPLPTISSTNVMTPVVASLDSRPSLVASPTEVERVFDVALSELAADGVFHEEWWRREPGIGVAPEFPEGEFPVWFFEVDGETVWGATGRTLVELLCVVLGVGVPSSLRFR